MADEFSSITWTPGRQVLAHPTTPASGLWWIDYQDPDHQGGAGNYVYRALPLWAILDFAYVPGAGAPLLLVGVPHDDGLRCVLRLYRLEGTPGSLSIAGSTEIESSEVSGAALGVRASGQVEVFYTKSQTLYHARSSDGGETFEPSTSFSLTDADSTAITPSQATWSQGSSDMAAIHRGGFVAFDYLPNGALAMVLEGRLSGAASDSIFMCRGEANGNGWSLGKCGTIFAPSSRIVSGVQTLRNGEPLLLPWGFWVRDLEMDGTWTLQGSLHALHNHSAGVMEALNQLITFSGTEPVDNDGSGRFRWRRSTSSEFNPATPAWVFVGQAATAERFKVWNKDQVNLLNQVTTAFNTRAGRVRMRRDGTWEHLCLHRSEYPQIVRANGIDRDGTPVTWS